MIILPLPLPHMSPWSNAIGTETALTWKKTRLWRETMYTELSYRSLMSVLAVI